MSFSFPFLNQVEEILNNYQISIVTIPRIDDHHPESEGESENSSEESISASNIIQQAELTEVSNVSTSNNVLYRIQFNETDISNINSIENLQGPPLYDFHNIDVFRSRSISLTIEVISKFCYSVLSGETLRKDGALNYMDALSKKLEAWIINYSTDLPSDFSLVVFNFFNTVKYCLKRNYDLIDFVIVNYSKDRFDNYFVLDKRDNDFINGLDNNVKNALKIFDVVDTLSMKDLFLKIDRSDFTDIRDLLEVVKHLGSLYPDITDVIRLKANFLLYKWHKRYTKDISSEDDFKLRIGVEVTSFKNHIKESNVFEAWNTKIERHYILEDDKKKYLQFAKATINKEKDLSNLKFYEFHTLIKYYKDILPSEEKLKSILDYLLQLDTESWSKYDQYCIEVIKDYAVNNYFSLCTQNKNLSIESCDILYEKCCGYLSGVSLNYFLQFKYLRFILDKIEKEVTEESNNDKLLQKSAHYYKLIENKYSKVLDEYYEKKNWAYDKNNYIFLLTSEESLIKINNPECELDSFIVFTSFVLPYNKNEIELNYSKTRQKFREVKSQLKIINTLRNDLNKLDSLNKEFDRKESRNMEIIGLFTAIITFILSSIPAFKFVDNIYQAILFTLSIASSLGLFVLIIFSFTRGARKVFIEERNWILFLVVCFLAIITYFSLINFENRSVKGIISAEIKNKEEAKVIDSLKRFSLYEEMQDSNSAKQVEDKGNIIDSSKDLKKK
ncbi:hypothetical protein EDC17_107111 [Sphingobacterium alimentarium]|uniref:Uncharacterized protein n=1 Tax=Sphingobacterium alimentarium TaxID=797292 RepID=A0A4R3VIT4_9SPHI|nr:hypothetical protein [Sphingobacterium alimentarium]TCV05657.1 hypothetical protein EDC17_107111 [Sphingobacterium alimentarium]